MQDKFVASQNLFGRHMHVNSQTNKPVETCECDL